MGIAKDKLWVTNTGDPSGDILLSAFKTGEEREWKIWLPSRHSYGL